MVQKLIQAMLLYRDWLGNTTLMGYNIISEVIFMNANTLIVAKNDLKKLQKNLGKELTRGKYWDSLAIAELRKEIKAMKLRIGDITKAMILQMGAE